MKNRLQLEGCLASLRSEHPAGFESCLLPLSQQGLLYRPSSDVGPLSHGCLGIQGTQLFIGSSILIPM